MKKEIVRIKLDKIIPNKNQPRLDFYDESIKGLAESIKRNGLLQPVTVRKNGDKFELIAGERRYRASLLNGSKDIEAIIMESSDEQSAKLALIENLQREDLNAIEQAMAMKRIMESEDLTQNELAERLGYKQSTVANKLRLLKLPEYIKELTEAHKRKGVSSNLRIGVNTIREAYELCKRSGIDSDMQVTEYEDNVKIVIRMKK